MDALQQTRLEFDVDTFRLLMEVCGTHTKPHVAVSITQSVPLQRGGVPRNKPRRGSWQWDFGGRDLPAAVFAPVLQACRWSPDLEHHRRALQLFRDMLRFKTPLTGDVAEAVLAMAVALPHPHAAQQVVNGAKAEGIALPVWLLESAVNVFMARKPMLEVGARTRGVLLGVVVVLTWVPWYQAAVTALDLARVRSESSGALDDSEDHIGEDTYRKVAEGCVSAGRVKLALHLLDNMPKKNGTDDSTEVDPEPPLP